MFQQLIRNAHKELSEIDDNPTVDDVIILAMALEPKLRDDQEMLDTFVIEAEQYFSELLEGAE